MKKAALLLGVLFVVSSSVCSSDFTPEVKNEKSQKRSEKLYTATKILSALSTISFLSFNFTYDVTIPRGVGAYSFLIASLANFTAHGALLWRAKQYPSLNKLSAGTGLAVNPLLWLLVGLNENFVDRPTFAMNSLVAIGIIKALYDGYDFFAKTSDDDSEDEPAVSEGMAETKE